MTTEETLAKLHERIAVLEHQVEALCEIVIGTTPNICHDGLLHRMFLLDGYKPEEKPTLWRRPVEVTGEAKSLLEIESAPEITESVSVL